MQESALHDTALLASSDRPEKLIPIQDHTLVITIGPSGSGKSTWCKKHFAPNEVVSSDWCHNLVADEDFNWKALQHAFNVLYAIVDARMKLGRNVVVDSTALKKNDRRHLIRLARENHYRVHAIVFDTPERIIWEFNRIRPNPRPEYVIKRQLALMQQTKRELIKNWKEEFDEITWIGPNPEELNFTRPVWVNQAFVFKDLKGPFDIIGDVHNCYEELVELLIKLGYDPSKPELGHPDGRILVFVGDLIDRGPYPVEVLRLILKLIKSGHAIWVEGNHDNKFLRWLRGNQVKITHGLDITINGLTNLPDSEREELIQEIKELHQQGKIYSYVILDEGKLVVTHAGIKEEMIGRLSPEITEFCRYGDVDQEALKRGELIRRDWASEYHGEPFIVYGHTVVESPRKINNTICIDTGCVFGGSLTAYRYPEDETVSVKAKRRYVELEMTPTHTVTPNLGNLINGYTVSTSFGDVEIPKKHVIPALQAFTARGADMRLVPYLPPTMSPPDVSKREDYLEHPDETFDYFFNRYGCERVVVQTKHMGSRGIIILFRTEKDGEKYTSLSTLGTIYTRTGRFFFNEPLQSDIIKKLHAELQKNGYFDRYQTDIVALDCEIMPWNLKARDLLAFEYDLTGQSAAVLRSKVLETLDYVAKNCGRSVENIQTLYYGLYDNALRFQKAWKNYCWNVDSLEQIRIAPFFVLGHKDRSYFDKPHSWHMNHIRKEFVNAPFFATQWWVVEKDDIKKRQEVVEAWERYTQQEGGEGFVFKPEMMVQADGKWVQPAIKCRGREYLRIIYGMDYLIPENLTRLKEKRSVWRKRFLAVREYALGREGWERFLQRQPLPQYHECALAVLALESEPIDPRL